MHTNTKVVSYTLLACLLVLVPFAAVARPSSAGPGYKDINITSADFLMNKTYVVVFPEEGKGLTLNINGIPDKAIIDFEKNENDDLVLIARWKGLVRSRVEVVFSGMIGIYNSNPSKRHTVKIAGNASLSRKFLEEATGTDGYATDVWSREDWELFGWISITGHMTSVASEMSNYHWIYVTD